MFGCTVFSDSRRIKRHKYPRMIQFFLLLLLFHIFFKMKPWLIGVALGCLILTCIAFPNSDRTKRQATCDCDYHPGGCVISIPPPEGHKCVCRYKGFWTCRQFAISCHFDEDCPANCSSKQCCRNGGGDCGGYP